ncbi:MAG TPA: AMP-binding protein, partial [Thermoanaerobaculia bacterium]
MDGRTPPPAGRIVEHEDGSRRAVEAGAGALLPEVLRRRAARHGGRPALVFLADGEAEGARVDYAGLAAAVGALAVRLAAAAAPGERALLAYPPGLDFAVAFLACLEAGVVAVPAYPPRRRRDDGRGGGRLARLAADVEPRLLLTTAALAPRVEAALPPAARPGAELWATDGTAAPDPAWRPPPLAAAAPAFLQYTSGTTGEPRGVVVTHGNLAACEEAIRRAFAQDEGSVVVGWLPPYHDMGLVGTLLQPLWCGGTGVLMAPAAFLQRPRRGLEAIDRYRATTTGGPDFGWLHCVRRVPPEERRGLDLSSLAVAFSGAEPVRPETLDAFAAAFAPCGFRASAFFPCYGLAEATLFVSGGEVAASPVVREVGRRGEPPRRRTGCGRAWPGEALRVVDPERRAALAPGEEGEIWIAGPAVAAGYWRRPAETAATFGARLADGSGPWLRTGDLGVLDRDGELFVTGRAKELVIVRGRNVHPEDVEAVAAAAHPAVIAGGAAAFAVEAGGEERLAVVVEIARRREAEAAAAVDAVRAAVLADQEVAPWRVVAVRSGGLPRTTSGKVRRGACREALAAGALPGLVEGGAGGAAASLAAEGGEGLARVVARLAAAVSALPAEVDRPLALDSLQAVELRERVAREAAVELPLEEILAGATPRRLAGSAVAAGEVPVLEPMTAEPGSLHPAAAGQRALWLVERLTPGGAGLHLAFAAAVRRGGAAPEAAAVERAIAVVVGRHAALRTSLPAPDGAPVQRVAAWPAVGASAAQAPGDDAAVGPALAAAAPALDFAAATAPGDETALREALAAAAAEPFDLERGPLVRARLWRRASDAVLLFVVHHAVADFWSLEIVVGELAAELAGERIEGPGAAEREPTVAEPAGPPAAPPADDTGFLAFARWQERLLASPAGRALEDWWRDELRGAPEALELPTDRPRPPRPSHRGESVPVPLPPAAGAAVAALAAAAGTTPFAVLLAAWQAVLARSAGAGEVVVGCAAAGRPSAVPAGAVGHFVNLLPLRGRLADDPPFVELAARAGRAVAGGLAHQDLPFPRIVEVAAARPDPARHPLVQAGLVLEAPRRLPAAGLAPFVLGAAGGRLALGPLELASLPLPRRSVQLDLLLTAVDAGEGLLAALDVAADLFDRATGERLAARLAATLAAAAAAPRERVSRLPMLAEAEARQALGLDTAGPPPAPPPLVPEAFFARARRRPEAPAVLWRGGGGAVRSLRYGDLAARAAVLAA